MKIPILKMIFSMLNVVFIAALYGCNTVKGVGTDIQNVGGVIVGSAEHVQESIKNNPPGSGMDK